MVIMKPRPAYLTQSDVITTVYPSPDQEHEVVVYYIDSGAYGRTEEITSLIPSKDKDKLNLNNYSLPYEYKFSKWLNNDTAEFVVDVSKYEAKKKKFRNKIKMLEGVKIEVKTL